VAAWTLQVEKTPSGQVKKHSPEKQKAHDLKIVGSGKLTGSIAYKSNVTHSIEPTCEQVQRQQQALLLLATAMRADTDIFQILAALLRTGKKKPRGMR
jgi:hypothetical protein